MMGKDSRIPARVRALARVSGALATGDPERVQQALSDAVRLAPGAEVEEVLVQSHLFLGFPAALNGLAAWRRISQRPAPAPRVDDPATRETRGDEVCRRVYGEQYRALRENIAGLHPDLDRWMVEEGYGKVLGRPGLSLVVRELCIAALLAVQGTPVQLYSHLRGALRTGASADEVEAVLSAVEPLAGPPAREAMWTTWQRVRGRAAGGEGGRRDGSTNGED